MADGRIGAPPRRPGRAPTRSHECGRDDHDQRGAPRPSDPLIDLDDLLPGGPPPNGIPSIDYPLFQPVAEVDWLEDEIVNDRLTESLWPQLTGRASVGAPTGTQLESIPVGAVGWAQFSEEHPDAPAEGLGLHPNRRRDVPGPADRVGEQLTAVEHLDTFWFA